MTDAIGSLISLLEQSQTQKDVPQLSACLARAQATLNAEQLKAEPLQLQRLVASTCSWLRSHEDFADKACIVTILRLLSQVLGQDQAADSIAIQKGLLSSTTAILQQELENPDIIKGCLDILATLSVVESSDAIINRLGTVAVVIELIRQNRERPAVLEDAITTLALMAKRTRHRRALQQGGGISILVDVLKRSLSRPTIVVAVSRFLSNFAVKEDCCLTVLRDGGVDALMAAFDNSVFQGPAGGPSPVDARAAVASAIWTCSADCSEVQSTLLASGWLASLAAVLQANPDHPTLHEAALGIVRGLSRNAPYREDIVNLGFIEATIKAMKKFPDNVVLLKEACGVFGNLASDPDIRVQLGESEVIQAVLAALAKCRTYDDRKVAKLALGALSNLASSEPNRAVMAKTDAVSILLGTARLFMRNENILEYAIGALSHLAVQEECNQQLIKAGAVEALLLFLQEHREDLHVTSKSLVALRRLLKQSHAAQPAVSQEIATAGLRDGHRGVQLLVDSMQAHVYDDTVVQETALLLTSLSRNPNNVPALMAIGVKPCMKALEVHQNEASVSDALAEFLGQMPIEEDEGWGQALTTSLLDKPDSSPSAPLRSPGAPLRMPGAPGPMTAAGGYPVTATPHRQ